MCLSLLGTWPGAPEENWQPGTSNFLQVAISIQSLILVPDPYFNEPGYQASIGTPMGKSQSAAYNRALHKQTMRWAMADMVARPPPPFEDIVRTHFRLQVRKKKKKKRNWSSGFLLVAVG